MHRWERPSSFEWENVRLERSKTPSKKREEERDNHNREGSNVIWRRIEAEERQEEEREWASHVEPHIRIYKSIGDRVFHSLGPPRKVNATRQQLSPITRIMDPFWSQPLFWHDRVNHIGLMDISSGLPFCLSFSLWVATKSSVGLCHILLIRANPSWSGNVAKMRREGISAIRDGNYRPQFSFTHRLTQW